MSDLETFFASATAIRVIGPAGGFRRAGYAFGPEPVIIAIDMLAARHIEALITEPALTVEIGSPPDDWKRVSLTDDLPELAIDEPSVVAALRGQLATAVEAAEISAGLCKRACEERDALREQLDAKNAEIAALSAAKAGTPAAKKPKAPSPTEAEG